MITFQSIWTMKFESPVTAIAWQNNCKRKTFVLRSYWPKMWFTISKNMSYVVSYLCCLPFFRRQISICFYSYQSEAILFNIERYLPILHFQQFNNHWQATNSQQAVATVLSTVLIANKVQSSGQAPFPEESRQLLHKDNVVVKYHLSEPFLQLITTSPSPVVSLEWYQSEKADPCVRLVYWKIFRASTDTPNDYV